MTLEDTFTFISLTASVSFSKECGVMVISLSPLTPTIRVQSWSTTTPPSKNPNNNNNNNNKNP